ncbi:MAG: hypothetical protein U1F43_29585 [Myxococcota bacterium]
MTLAAASCPSDGLDDVIWSCLTSDECGAGQRCSDHRCRALDPREPVDSCPMVLPAGRVTADLHHDPDGGAFLRLTFDGQSSKFRLPADVRAVSLPSCCQHVCCAERGR